MKMAKISELKNELSRFLRYVRKGESVLVYDRDRPIARIDPVRERPADAADEWTGELVEAGVLGAPANSLPTGWLEGRPSVRGDIVAALLEERRSGR